MDEVFSQFILSPDPIAVNPSTSTKVYRGIDSQTNRQVAYKVVRKPIDQTTEMEREMGIQTLLVHPFICEIVAARIYEKEREALLVIVTDLAESDLKKEIDKRAAENSPWTEEELMNIAAMVISALKFCQEQECVHRDVKPQNIFLTEQGQAKLGDFGSARETPVLMDEFSMAGTLPYMSPKLRNAHFDYQRRGVRPIHNPYKSDVFSLGVTLLHMALLQLPDKLKFLDSQQEAIAQYLQLLLRFPSFVSLLRKMLAIDEETRADFRELAEFLGPRISQEPLESNYFVSQLHRCLHCRKAAKFFCVCAFPLVFLCDSCTQRHPEREKHVHLAIADASKIKSQTDLDRVTSRLSVRKNCIENIDTAVESVNTVIREVEEKLNRLIEGIVNAKNREVQRLVRLKMQFETVKDYLSEELLRGITDPDRPIYEEIVRIPTPYSSPSVSFYSPDINSLYDLHTSSEIRSLEVLNRAPLFPFFTGNSLKTYNPLTRQASNLIPLPQESVLIDYATSFTYVNKAEVAGCGGSQRGTQAFLIDLFAEGSVKRLSNMLTKCEYSGAIRYKTMVFVFGGCGRGRDAESVPLSGNITIILQRMPNERMAFNPCLFKDRIYLFGPVVDIYNPEQDDYCNFRLTDYEPEVTSSLIVDERMLVFGNGQLLKIDPSSHEVSRSRVEWFRNSFSSNPSAILLGSFIVLSSATTGVLILYDYARRVQTPIQVFSSVV